MGGARGRGPDPLRFLALRDSLACHIDLIPDQRQAGKISYGLRDCYLSGFAMFFLQDPSLLEFQRRFQQTIQSNNLSTVFGVEQIPADSQLRELIDSHAYEPLLGVYAQWFHRLRRSRLLERYQVLNGHYLITIDGSGYFGSERICCSKCLHKQRKDGSVHYSHQILQATLVHPEMKQVIPLAPEFIRNTDGTTVQDCETKAGKRLLDNIRRSHRQLPAIIVADSLYSNQPLIEELTAQRFSFILGAKPSDHKSLYQDIEGWRSGKLLDQVQHTDQRGRTHHYEWVNQLALNGRADSLQVNFVEYRLIRGGKTTYHGAWVTDLPIDAHNVQQIVRAARSRWKIENEGFNTLKNHGYHLEHNFGHGKHNLSEAFFVLNLLAFFAHQIFELVDRLYQQARARFSSRRQFWNVIRGAFALLLFESWDQVLARMNSPPLPSFS